MSQNAFARAENKIQQFFLKPLSLMFLVATALMAYHRVWWAAGVFVALWFYVGGIGARLRIHAGKGFSELAQGVTPNLAPSDQGGLTAEERHYLTHTMTRVVYAITAAAVVPIIVSGVKVWWALLIGIGIWWAGTLVFGLAMALMWRKQIIPQ